MEYKMDQPLSATDIDVTAKRLSLTKRQKLDIDAPQPGSST